MIAVFIVIVVLVLALTTREPIKLKDATTVDGTRDDHQIGGLPQVRDRW